MFSQTVKQGKSINRDRLKTVVAEFNTTAVGLLCGQVRTPPFRDARRFELQCERNIATANAFGSVDLCPTQRPLDRLPSGSSSAPMALQPVQSGLGDYQCLTSMMVHANGVQPPPIERVNYYLQYV
jgi:hypothetical protein